SGFPPPPSARRSEPVDVGGTICDVTQHDDVPRHILKRTNQRAEISVWRRRELKMIRTTDVADGPTKHVDRDAPELRSVDTKREQGLQLARCRPKDEGPRGFHCIGLCALRPRAVPRPR